MPNAYGNSSVSLPDLSSLNRLVYFVAVVETGSFTAAAERLGITKAVVSQQVARLEQAVRTTLLIRSTRKVRTTEAGQAFYHRCGVILKEAEDAFGELSATSLEPAGTLKLTAPFDYGISKVIPVVSAFSRRYPQCKVEAAFSDQALDVVAADIDLAIRVGWLTEQQVQARRIGTFRQLLVAPAGWHEQLAAVREPEDLLTLPFVANGALREPARASFVSPGGAGQSVHWKPAITLDATLAVREATRHGAGLSILPDYTVGEDLIRGRLLPVLPDWSLPEGGIFAVFPAARFRPAKVRAFVEMLVSYEPSTYPPWV